MGLKAFLEYQGNEFSEGPRASERPPTKQRANEGGRDVTRACQVVLSTSMDESFWQCMKLEMLILGLGPSINDGSSKLMGSIEWADFPVCDPYTQPNGPKAESYGSYATETGSVAHPN